MSKNRLIGAAFLVIVITWLIYALYPVPTKVALAASPPQVAKAAQPDSYNENRGPVSVPIRGPYSVPSVRRAPLSFARPGRTSPQPGALGTDGEYERLKLKTEVAINERAQVPLAARAIPTAQYFPSLGEELYKLNGFTIYSDPELFGREVGELVMAAGRPVVVNPANGRLGIISGTLIVQLHDEPSAVRLATHEGIKILHWDYATRTAYYKTPDGYQILAGSERMRRDRAVETVEIEILQGARVAH